jgi:beta-lysine 5,6-aminomutase beta subunit
MSGEVIRPYGDTTGDGQVQVSFTLPVPFGNEEERMVAEGAALQLASKMGLDPAMVVHAKGMGPDFTFFIVYGRTGHLVDLSAVTITRREFPLLSPAEINLRLRSGLGRKLVVLGACIGTDAHTVGIDAILNVKGHAGEKGLEYYREIRVVNLGAQVDVADLVARAQAEQADAVLVSQVVTQREAHLAGARQLSAAFRAAYPAGRPLLVVGGPRFDPAMAGDLGVDKIFGRATTPREVASYLVHALVPEPALVAAGLAGTGLADTGLADTGLADTGLADTGLADTGLAGTGLAGPGRRGSVTAATPAGGGRHDGLTVTHRRYVPASHAHYGGNLVDGAYVLALFGDVATEAAIRTDGDEGLFASYSDVQFRAPVLAGDVIEVTATVLRTGRRSRGLAFEARVVCRADPGRGPSASRVLEEPVIVVTATGTVVVPLTS